MHRNERSKEKETDVKNWHPLKGFNYFSSKGVHLKCFYSNSIRFVAANCFDKRKHAVKPTSKDLTISGFGLLFTAFGKGLLKS